MKNGILRNFKVEKNKPINLTKIKIILPHFHFGQFHLTNIILNIFLEK